MNVLLECLFVSCARSVFSLHLTQDKQRATSTKYLYAGTFTSPEESQKKTPIKKSIGLASFLYHTHLLALRYRHGERIYPQLPTQVLPLLQPSRADTAQVDGVLPKEVDFSFFVPSFFVPILGFSQTVEIPKERETGVRGESGISGEIILVCRGVGHSEGGAIMGSDGLLGGCLNDLIGQLN